jgi:hypothetical protein
MSKRGQASNVEEIWMSPCNQEGMSPFQNSVRLNMRTILARQREYLQTRADERHGWDLEAKDAKVRELTEMLEVEEYEHLLERKAGAFVTGEEPKEERQGGSSGSGGQWRAAT